MHSDLFIRDIDLLKDIPAKWDTKGFKKGLSQLTGNRKYELFVFNSMTELLS
jgi:hypothetical protein